MRWARLFPLWLVVTGLSAAGLAAAATTTQAPAGSPQPSANDLVRKVVQHEIELGDKDHSHWTYRQVENIPAPKKQKIVVQTPSGDVDYLDGIDGKPLSPAQRSAETERIQRFLGDPAQQKKARNADAADTRKSTELFAMLPDAFLFDYGETDGDNLKLNFKPNPKFTSHSAEAFIFHKMDGFVIVNQKENRLVEIYGHLDSKVEFAGGMFGHLDQGGTFDVQRHEIAPDYWAITRLKVDMNGKILFFKTIAEHQDEVDSDFHRVGDNTTLAEAAAMAQKETLPQPPLDKALDHPADSAPANAVESHNSTAASSQ